MNAVELQEFRKQRLLELVGEKFGGNRANLGRAMGLGNGAFVNQMISGHRPVTEKTIEKIYEIHGCEGWFDEPEKRGRRTKLTLVPPAAKMTTKARYGASDETLVVPLLANAGSMGLGNELLAEDVVRGDVVLANRWVLEQLRPSSPEALRFLSGYGDSMAPTFSSGDVLLVDTGIREVRVDGVFVLQAHDRLFIKRVRQRIDGAYEISSDNPTHKTVDILDGSNQVDVVGRVVWVWNGKKL